MPIYKDRKKIEARIQQQRTRLDLYLAREADMLGAGVQSYTVGPRSLARYNTALADIRNTIKALEDEIAELEALLSGGSRRRAMAVVPHDW